MQPGFPTVCMFCWHKWYYFWATSYSRSVDADIVSAVRGLIVAMTSNLSAPLSLVGPYPLIA